MVATRGLLAGASRPSSVAALGRPSAVVTDPLSGESVTDFNRFVLGTGGRPFLRVNEQKLLRGPFWLAVTITDNATVDADLTLGSIWDKRVQGHYSSAASRLKAVLRISGIGLYINDSDFRGETLALKESLDNLAYMRVSRGPNTVDLPLRGRIFEPWSQFQFAQAMAAADERALFGGRPWMLERPYGVDLEVDTMSFRLDTAINWASGNILGYICILGHIAPRDYPGTGAKDVDVCQVGTEAFTFASVGPTRNAQLIASGFGGASTMGAIAPSAGAVVG